MVDADLAETQTTEQVSAWSIFDKNARERFPKASRFRRLNERLHSEPPCALPSRRARDIDGELGDARVTVAGAIGRASGKGDDTRFPLYDDDGMDAVEPTANIIR